MQQSFLNLPLEAGHSAYRDIAVNGLAVKFMIGGQKNPSPIAPRRSGKGASIRKTSKCIDRPATSAAALEPDAAAAFLQTQRHVLLEPVAMKGLKESVKYNNLESLIELQKRAQ